MRLAEKLLNDTYERFLEKHGLPGMSADELLYERLEVHEDGEAYRQAAREPINLWLDRFIGVAERAGFPTMFRTHAWEGPR